MKTAWLAFSAALVIGIDQSLAGEYELGRLSQPPCTKVEYRAKTIFPGLKTKIPEVKQAAQTVILTAFVDGPGVDSPQHADALRQCVDQASSSISLPVLASDTAGASGLFRDTITDCLKVRAPSVKVTTAFLKSESKCAW